MGVAKHNCCVGVITQAKLLMIVIIVCITELNMNGIKLLDSNNTCQMRNNSAVRVFLLV